MLHLYYFAFTQTPDGVGEHFTSATLGLEQPKVTLQVIAEARRTAGARPDAFMSCCSYLGEMTFEEFRAGYA